MTTIDPKDLKPGDRFRVTDVSERTVTSIQGPYIVSGNTVSLSMELPETMDGAWTRTFELVERPIKVGSIWVDPKDGEEAIALWNGDFMMRSGIVVSASDNPHIFKRLVPKEEA